MKRNILYIVFLSMFLVYFIPVERRDLYQDCTVRRLRYVEKGLIIIKIHDPDLIQSISVNSTSLKDIFLEFEKSDLGQIYSDLFSENYLDCRGSDIRIFLKSQISSDLDLDRYCIYSIGKNLIDERGGGDDLTLEDSKRIRIPSIGST